MPDHEDTRPTTPLDEVYAALLREQPDNEVLWQRIIARAKGDDPTGLTPHESPAMMQQRKAHQKQRAMQAGLITGEPDAEDR